MDFIEQFSSDKYLREHAKDSWINNAWMGLGDTSKLEINNPILYRSSADRENPGLHILRIMRNPEYLGFTCKFLFNIDLLPFQMVVLQELWKRRFPMLIMNRGGSKTWCLGMYAWLKGVLYGNTKIVGAGAGFRQSKLIFEKMIDIWNSSDVLRSVCDNSSGPKRDVDRCTMHMNTSTAIFIPIGDGERIRGLRASIILADEMACLASTTLIQTDKGLIRIADYLDGNEYSLINMNNGFEKPDVIFTTPKTDVYKITTKGGYSFKCSSIHQVLTSNGWKVAKDLTNDDCLEMSINDYFPEEYLIVGGKVFDEKAASLIGESFFQKKTETIPNIILRSPRSVVKSFISSGFFYYQNKFRHCKEDSIDELQILLLKFGVVTQKMFDGGFWTLKIEDFTENNFFSCVKSVELLPDKEVLYDFHLPQTHSFYGNGFIQHNSIPPEIYETVIAGFGAVSANPVQDVKEAARRKAMKDAGIWNESSEQLYLEKAGNQAIITGTAYYSFNHFYDYWKRYSGIVRSRGDVRKLKEILGGKIPDNFNWRDYSVIRIPYELMPEGFMDMEVVARAEATVHSGIYLCEYSSVFCADSDGFFKRSLIESCVTNDVKPILINGCPIIFDTMTRGNPTKKYVIGVDPASEADNFSIVVLELNEDHTRVVYCWTTTRKNFKQRQNVGMTDEHDFYKFCARKIRDLMSVFPTQRIAMDAQGGGISVSEALHDPANLKVGELPIWDTIDEDKPKDTDDKHGLHILELCNFSKYDWVRDSNHGLRKDMEDKVLLFPRFDGISLEIAVQEDADKARFYKGKTGKILDIFDTLEDCIMEIEELKNELSTITVTMTGTGVNARERWDVPEIKLAGNKKGRLRKDRYSALLMANMIARQIHRTELPIQYKVIGGFSRDLVANKGEKNQRMYDGPAWFVDGGWMKNIGGVVKRGV